MKKNIITNSKILCRFGCVEEACAIWWFDKGCAAENNWHLQPLCMHHTRRVQPLGSMKLVLDLTLEQVFENE